MKPGRFHGEDPGHQEVTIVQKSSEDNNSGLAKDIKV